MTRFKHDRAAAMAMTSRNAWMSVAPRYRDAMTAAGKGTE